MFFIFIKNSVLLKFFCTAKRISYFVKRKSAAVQLCLI